MRVPRLGLAAAVLFTATAVPSVNARLDAGQGGVVVAGTIGPAETDLSPDQAQYLLGEYWGIAKGYLGADPAKAIKDMSGWTRDRVGKVQSLQYQPEGALPTNFESRAEWNPRFLRGAAMLHTEIAIAALRDRVMDTFEFQVNIADGWLALADNRKSAPGGLRSRWNVAMNRFAMVNGEVGVADRLLMKLVDRIPNDPSILLLYGTVKETEASRFLVGVANGKVDAPSLTALPRDSALNTAVSMFQRALAADPNLLEAKVRLARVFTIRNDDAKAEALLNEVLAAKPAPVLTYLADLLLGGIRERQKQLDPAARLYLAALLAVPDGQTAYIALSHVMHAANQPNDAATVLDRLFNRGIVGGSADPWWLYPLGLDVNPETRFNDIRTEIRK